MKTIAFPTQRSQQTSQRTSRGDDGSSAANPSNEPAKRKMLGFDAVRGVAALAVVLLHACVPYLQNPMPGLVWSVRDSASQSVDWLFWGIEIFIMPLFLVLAGYFAWQTLSSRGSGPLVRSRAKRLLVPLGFAVCVVLPLDLYTWVLGWVVEGVVEPVKLKSLKFDGDVDRDLWGLSHLWFLLYVFLYVVVVAVAARFDSLRHIIDKIAQRPAFVVTLLVGTGIVTLMIAPEVVWGFQHAFLPVLSKWVYSGTFFAAGMLIAKVDPRLAWFQHRVPSLAIASVMLLVTAVSLGRWNLQYGDSMLAQSGLAIATVLAAYSVTLLAIAVSRKINHLSLSLQYLAAASFWIYLVHHPILGLVHIDLKQWMPATNPSLKMAAAFCIAVGLSLLSYEGLVRRTRLGRMLGMQWTPPTQTVDVLPMQRESAANETVPQRRAA
ncbi:acyltransferase 3 [Rhodopirellula maiorica SM1]|uniref:Acyltransferase 3 n=1 Tax=Rhodopirellula maiorica SM1 TaxID=1265738 RepID=M5RPT1_9BACT|nr:acyltransferase [Rhodopirellula maiorica]EMI15979.1 acyltransferase 3 [Rhodopirellula maiorica SM1]